MTGSILKIIAAITMFVDHAGLMLFPGQFWMRLVGRIAFPLYAYCIAEGFRYTRSRLRYFLQIFLLGVGCQIVYTIAERELYFGILLTFSLSIVLMAAADGVMRSMRREETWLDRLALRLGSRKLSSGQSAIGNGGIFFLVLGGIWVLTQVVSVDYGFFGVILPLFAFLPEKVGTRKILFGIGMLMLALEQYFPHGSTAQFWSVMALPLLFAYNGKPGRFRMKWFFYIFYPAHMAFLYLLSMLL